MNRSEAISMRSFVVLSALVLLPAFPLQAAAARSPKSIAYSHDGAPGDLTSLDVYSPAEGAELPVVIWIHGGAWQIGDKAVVQLKPRVFNERGFVFVSINYRLHPAVDYKQQGSDVARAIAWVRDHARDFGASPDHLFLMGHSAGAHLAALVAIDERYLQQVGLTLDAIKGVMLLDGAAYDISRQIESAPLLRSKNMYRSVFTDDAEMQSDASPITHVAKAKGIPPFLILYVAARRDGKSQAEALGQRLQAADVPAQVVPAENKTHASINREIGESGDEPTRHIFEFLDKHSPNRKKTSFAPIKEMQKYNVIALQVISLP